MATLNIPPGLKASESTTDQSFEELPAAYRKAVHAQCGLEDAAELSGLALLGAAQSALKLHSKSAMSPLTRPARRGSAHAYPAPPMSRQRAGTGGGLVRALRRLVVGSSDATAGDSAAGDKDAEDADDDIREGQLSSSATSTESHSRASSDLLLRDSGDDSSLGISSSGGAPSRDITDDEQEDSDSENEALRSARAGSRRRRTRRRHSKAKQEFGSDFIKPLSGTPPRQFALDSSSKFECAKTSSCEQEPDNFIIGGTNGLSPQLLGAIWADLDNVNSSSFHIAAMQCEPYGTTHCNSFNDAAATAAAAAAAGAAVPSSSSSSSSSSSASESAHQGNTNQFDVTLDTFSRGADAKVPSMEFVEFVAPIHAPRTLPLVNPSGGAAAAAEVPHAEDEKVSFCGAITSHTASRVVPIQSAYFSSPFPPVITSKTASFQAPLLSCDLPLFLPSDQAGEKSSIPIAITPIAGSSVLLKLVTPEVSKWNKQPEMQSSPMTESTHQLGLLKDAPYQEPLSAPLLDTSSPGERNRFQLAEEEEKGFDWQSEGAQWAVTDVEALTEGPDWAPWHEEACLEEEFTAEVGATNHGLKENGGKEVDEDGIPGGEWATVKFQETFVPLFAMDTFAPEPSDHALMEPSLFAATAADISASLFAPAEVPPNKERLPPLQQRKKPLSNVNTELRRDSAPEAWPELFSAFPMGAAGESQTDTILTSPNLFTFGKDTATSASSARPQKKGYKHHGTGMCEPNNGNSIRSSMDSDPSGISANGGTSPVPVVQPRTLRPLLTTSKRTAGEEMGPSNANTKTTPAAAPAQASAGSMPKDSKQTAAFKGAAFELRDSMPPFKRQPVGKTGVRFVIEHNFVTASGTWYNGFSLQFPKIFGLGAEKCKDMTKLVRRRNEKLRTYAASRTTLTPAEFETWLAALEKAPISS